MKNILSILFLSLSLGLMAQQSPTSDFVVLTPKIEQLKPILLAAEKLQPRGDFQVILYGKEVGQLTNRNLREFIAWAQKESVTLSVCNMSLEMLKIDPASIPEEFEIVDNAFLSALQLQKQGYINLSL